MLSKRSFSGVSLFVYATILLCKFVAYEGRLRYGLE
jgi:hypothetical protein